MVETQDDLLEYLAKRMGCAMLSELRRPELRSALLRAVRDIPAEMFSSEQWREALDYLLRPLDTAGFW